MDSIDKGKGGSVGVAEGGGLGVSVGGNKVAVGIAGVEVGCRVLVLVGISGRDALHAVIAKSKINRLLHPVFGVLSLIINENPDRNE